MTLNLFIDTNVYLDFYHFSANDLEELRKLSTVLAAKQIRLHLPDQVVREFHRNRDTQIAKTVDRLREQSLNLKFPQICKEFAEYEQLRDLQKRYERLHSELIARIRGAAEAHSLKADSIIGELFERGEAIDTSDLVEQVRRRVERGDPPGKKGSIGDALNWEALLSHAPDRETLHFISGDKDFVSSLSDGFDGFLLQEWRSRKNCDLSFHRTLSGFFGQALPEIRLAGEVEKALLIRDLANSSTFASTHQIVSKLRSYPQFTAEEANAIVDAALSNNQVRWITGDPDVRELLEQVIEGNEERIDPENLALIWDQMAAAQEAEEIDDAERT